MQNMTSVSQIAWRDPPLDDTRLHLVKVMTAAVPVEKKKAAAKVAQNANGHKRYKGLHARLTGAVHKPAIVAGKYFEDGHSGERP